MSGSYSVGGAYIPVYAVLVSIIHFASVLCSFYVGAYHIKALEYLVSWRYERLASQTAILKSGTCYLRFQTGVREFREVLAEIAVFGITSEV